MRRVVPATLVLTVLVTLLCALAVAPRAAAPLTAEPRVIEIVAKRFQFTPNLVTLKKDEPVVLRLRSEDVVHGFFQRPLGINTTIQPGKTTDVPLTPHEAGKYSIICHHFCGAGHGNMKMTVVVE